MLVRALRRGGTESRRDEALVDGGGGDGGDGGELACAMATVIMTDRRVKRYNVR